ncbi:maltokinase N-terminal cap-like domain-containing protein [Microbacterium telephonicum]|uniref:Maltokinase n=1 Tax=Microbacterium telephonicum TaxID=1714841 RepID=A0A498BUK1_9MICO|nr:phosphotransferase [Microbacterium telephonicum]RLK47553.1 maltokinase [Microbacterium telephonicum]
MTDIDPALWEDYLVRTRWFAAKGRPFRVTTSRVLAEMAGGDGRPVVSIHLVSVAYDDDEGGGETYQVPLSAYPETQERLAHAHVGLAHSERGTLHLYDAVHDADAMALWLDAFVDAEDGGVAEVGGLRFHRVPNGGALDPALRSSPMTGEQSNSSARFDDTAIMKLFRKVTRGVNPDVEIHDELTRGGSEHIAALYGWVEATIDGEVVQLAMLQEFLRTAADGFELATGSIRTLLADPEQELVGSGGDFAGEAARLGAALADVHAMLRSRFPAERRGADAATALAETMSARLERVLLTAPELEPYAERLRALYGSVAQAGGLDVQRIHGDLHLGQTLRTAHGWRIVDFEGEPGRPIAERALPDSPWRDVAGMLRSFDYAVGVVAMAAAGSSDDDDARRTDLARQWAERARTHFVEAYVDALLGDADGDDRPDSDGATRRLLLDAYVADKAVYEVLYEKRNRPAWVSIPLAAVAEVAGT